MSLLPAIFAQRLTQSIAQFRVGQLDCVLQVSKRRRTIGFKVMDGCITLQVPYGLPVAELELAVNGRRAWLLEKQRQQLALPKASVQRLIDGENWPLLGRNLRLTMVVAKLHRIRVVENQLFCELTRRQQSLASKQRLLENWYKKQALGFVEHRVNYWQQVMTHCNAQSLGQITVRRFSARWGSCSSCGDLKFNWLLAMAPEFVFDYVVVHELCHLRYMHHGKAFWQLLRIYCPDYQNAKQWLRDHGHSLVMRPVA
ncbi:MAG: M48 family metallopeptidase [Gammaproteobacteria bacterium]|jgi:predicted metal-dependent hydrolase|nr:M48 family metallopeptidase [Gammaproteobacteria bacterium]